MTEPTKEEYQRALDFVSYALEHANEVTLQHDAQILVERALRLAANLPSESEIERIIDKYVFESGEGELQRADEAAARILKRIRSVK